MRLFDVVFTMIGETVTVHRCAIAGTKRNLVARDMHVVMLDDERPEKLGATMVVGEREAAPDECDLFAYLDVRTGVSSELETPIPPYKPL